MKEMWDDRFSGEDYVYGTQPNLFFKEKIRELKPGRLLLPAEGEGRNAVFAAGLGWQVLATDFSRQGREKALKLAENAGVQFEYAIGDLAAQDFGTAIYDAAALIYVHLTPDIRRTVHRRIMKSIKPGGYLILESFNKRQINNNSGGPKSIDMLYSIPLLEDDFEGLHFEILEELSIYLEQGIFHKGESEVIRVVGRKK